MAVLDLNVQVRDLLAGYAPLTALLAEGANSVLPRTVAGVWRIGGKDTATPFLTIHTGAETALDEFARLATVDVAIYDDPLQNFGRINDIMAQLVVAVSQDEGRLTQPATRLGWQRLNADYTLTDEAYDDPAQGGWDKNFRIMRFGAS